MKTWFLDFTSGLSPFDWIIVIATLGLCSYSFKELRKLRLLTWAGIFVVVVPH